MEGTVLAVGSKTETPTGHTYPVEVVVKNTKTLGLKVGMFVRVEIATQSVTKALTIPAEAMMPVRRARRVFVVENGVARLRPITIGIRSGDRCQMLQGLKEGESLSPSASRT